jgi:hypothetical protein
MRRLEPSRPRAPWRTGDPRDRLAALRRMFRPSMFPVTSPYVSLGIVGLAVLALIAFSRSS